MSKKSVPTLILSLLVILTIACRTSTPAAEPSAMPTDTPDVQATIDAAMAATSTALAGVQATVDTAVSSTSEAMPPTPTPGPTVEYMEMTEEELEAMINQAVNEAVATTEQASTATSDATADETVTSEEAEVVEVYVAGAEEAIAYAEELIGVYYDLYGELAVETIELLLAAEDDLEEMATAMIEIAELLIAIEDDLSQGIALAEETVLQLENAAQQAVTNLAQVQSQVRSWAQNVQVERENRAAAIANIQPDNVPVDRLATLATGFQFVDQVRAALGDNKLSRDELNSIGQLSANLSAGLLAHGGAQFEGLSGKLSEITAQLARGQVPHARDGLGDFEASLGQRPEGLPQPGGGLPRPGEGGGLSRP